MCVKGHVYLEDIGFRPFYIEANGKIIHDGWAFDAGVVEGNGNTVHIRRGNDHIVLKGDNNVVHNDDPRGTVELDGNNNSVIYSSTSRGWSYVDGCDPGSGNRIAYMPGAGGRTLPFSEDGPVSYSVWAEDGIDDGPSARLRIDTNGDAQADISVILLGVVNTAEDYYSPTL